MAVGKLKYSEKTCPSATLSTTNPTSPDLTSNPRGRGGKPATNRLSYDTALLLPFFSILFSSVFSLLFPLSSFHVCSLSFCGLISFLDPKSSTMKAVYYFIKIVYGTKQQKRAVNRGWLAPQGCFD
jgi:hypothetical protein